DAVGVAPRSTTSSSAAVIFPFPSAAKLPARARYAPLKSSPLIENPYCPFRLATEKPPVGGGGVFPDPPQPLRIIAPPIVDNASRRFIAHLPARSAWPHPSTPPAKAGSRLQFAPPPLATLSAQSAPRIAFRFPAPPVHR